MSATEMIDERGFENLVASIYEAGADFGRWPDTLRLIAKAYHAQTVVFGMTSENVEEMWTIAPDVDPRIHENYAAHYHRINPIWQLALPVSTGTVLTDTMLIPKRELVRTEFFCDFLRPQGVGSMLGAIAHTEHGRHFNVVVQRKRTFGDDDIKLHHRLAPHLQRAVQLNCKLAGLEMQSAASAEVLNCLGRGAFLVDAGSRVHFANREAEQLLGAGDGLQLVGGVLTARSAADTGRLHALVAACDGPITTCGGGFLALRREAGQSALTLSISPLRTPAPPFQLTSRPVAIIFIADPDQSRASSPGERIKQRYNLSPRETAFALEVLKGDGLQACADRLGICKATARTHLAHIFDKTGARRQAELVRILMQVERETVP